MIPAFAVMALLCIAAAAPNKRPAAPTMPAPPPLAAPCLDFSHTGSGDSTLSFENGDGVQQPLPEFATAVGCSLSVNTAYYNYAFTSVREWDPTTLMPDPETVALRTATVTPSAFTSANGFSMPWLIFIPPVITRSLAGVAEPPRPTIALDVRTENDAYPSGLTARYKPDGSADIPSAVAVSAGGSHGVLEGSHPVLAHAICGGDDDLQSLRIAQSVRRTDVTFSDRPAELVQQFRVAQAVELRWVELALTVPLPTPPPPATVVAIVDPAGATDPPVAMPAPLIEAVFPAYQNIGAWIYQSPPRWSSHLDFDRTITLQPGRDYWLYVRNASPITFLGRTLTGSEGGDFTAGVGPFHTRADSAGPWTPVTDKVLAFKIVGRPTATTPVPPHDTVFLMHVAPNPASGLAQVTWSGAVGPVRFEVYDAHGRRVATAEGGAAGSWSWSIKDSHGQPLRAGVYFVRARDSAGSHSEQRVVITP